MQEIIKEILPILTTAFIAILVAIIGYVGKATVKLVPIILDLVSVKLGLAKYLKLKSVATDIFYKIEEDGRLNRLVDSKIYTFESLIKDKFPSITDKEINELRQAISGEFNICK